MTTTKPVLCRTRPTRSGHKIGVLTLNAEAAMNAVDLTMVNMIDRQLQRWQDDSRVVAVVMRGAGDKAFCAGGDIRKLYDSMTQQGKKQYQYADDFFRGEYSKNYRVHLFNKPLIAWGNGFVMGGGLGLFVGASHRVGTESLKLAWPEVRIGLFPDVAASWYLSRLPYPVGHWMALSGSHMNAVDCKSLKLTQYSLRHDQYESLLKQLRSAPWGTNRAENHRTVRGLLRAMEPDVDADSAAAGGFAGSKLAPATEALNEMFSSPELDDIAVRFDQYKGDNAWLRQGIDHFRRGCPATARLIMEQLRRGAQMSLREVVQWELVLAWQAVRHPDFAEGIRAMVIDKDFRPRWQHASVADVPEHWTDALMTSPWKASEHPLADL
ncbi:MAG: enoyl-CoA hydratase [Oceanospirillaceae bacterium]|nr:enoyl-CoA hydratase [Oceanospirillaceae bacterium]